MLKRFVLYEQGSSYKVKLLVSICMDHSVVNKGYS